MSDVTIKLMEELGRYQEISQRLVSLVLNGFSCIVPNRYSNSQQKLNITAIKNLVLDTKAAANCLLTKSPVV